MSETNTNQEEILYSAELTPQEYDEARKNAVIHLKKEISFLKVEKEYQSLMADVEEAKTRRISMIAQQARFYAQREQTEAPQEPQATKGSDNDIDKPKRKLKTAE